MTLLNSIPVLQSAHLDLLVDFRCGIHIKTLHVTRSQTGFLQDPTRCVPPARQLSKIPQFPRLLCASIMVTRLTMCLHPFLLEREAVLGPPAANGCHVCVSSPSAPGRAVGWTGPCHLTASYKTSDKGIHVGLHWPVWACNPSQSPTRKDLQRPRVFPASSMKRLLFFPNLSHSSERSMTLLTLNNPQESSASQEYQSLVPLRGHHSAPPRAEALRQGL